jgi:cytochrome b subunit of formate dehydrogenase
MSSTKDFYQSTLPGYHTNSAQRYFERMNFQERIQHHLTWSTFVLLAITGFMVEMPEEWIALFNPHRDLVFYWRGIIHRIAAVVMMATMFYQAWYMLFTTPGRSYLHALLPRLQDVKDAVMNIAYYLRITHEKPRFDRFNYKEKLEYWTGIIGSVIITVTGLILWFEVYFSKFLIDVSVLVHTMEAILASSAIMVWHFYEVHLKPGKFPMSTVWLNGKISEHEMMEEHPLEYERMLKSQK